MSAAPIRDPALISKPITCPLSRSSTRSTSSSASVRKWPAVTGASDQLACFEYLANGEGLKEMAVLGEGRGRGLSDFLRGQVQQPCHDARIYEMDLGMAGNARPERGPPCGQAVDEEHRLQELCVVLRRGLLQADCSADCR